MTNPVNYIITIVLVHIVFIAGIWLVYGIQPSISDSWYALKKKHPLFTFYLWILGYCLCMLGGLTSNVFYFLSGAGLIFTGAAAEFKERITKTVHVVGALSGILLVFAGQIYVSLKIRHEGFDLNALWVPAAAYTIIAILIYLIKPINNKTWWIENVAVPLAVFGLVKEFVL